MSIYATVKRGAEPNGEGYEPTLSATTKNLGDRVEICIRDNGTGIPSENSGEDLLAVLYDQARRRRDWAWAVAELRYSSETARRHD
jgi:signal transduction histidine kinase